MAVETIVQGITGDVTPFFAFYGLAFLVGMCLAVYVIYQVMRFTRMEADKEEAYNNTEIVALDEMIKRTKPKLWDHIKILEAQKNRKFRKRLEEELVKDFFNDREQKKEPNMTKMKDFHNSQKENGKK